MNLKNKILLLLVQTCQNRTEVPCIDLSRDNDRIRKEYLYMEMSRDNDQNDAYISNEMQLRSHSLTFILKNKTLLSATSFLFCSSMAYNNTGSLDKLTCTNYMDFR